MLGSRESIIRNKRKKAKAWLFPFASNYSSVIREFSNGLWKLLEGSWKHNHRPFCGDLQVRNRISTMTHNLTALSEIFGYIILLNLKIITTVLFFRFLEMDTGCVEFGCSYIKLGSPPGDVYCFKPGSYEVQLSDECSLQSSKKLMMWEWMWTIR